MITELRYSSTNTYLISGRRGNLLWDTGWAGTFPLLCRALGEHGLRLQDIRFLLISHFHPDHMGIAQELADAGVTIAAADVQQPFLHAADSVFEKEKHTQFRPIQDAHVRIVPLVESCAFLRELGIRGTLLHTPGHSDDSISLWLDREKALFVGDLNPLYELDMHRGTQIGQSWETLLSLKPERVYYGHAKPAELHRLFYQIRGAADDGYLLVKTIMKLTDKGCSAAEIQEKTGADLVFIEDAVRMYLTHRNVSVQGILDRIEIKGR